MACVKIGGKELRVLEGNDPGSFERDMELARISDENGEAKTRVAQFKRFAQMVYAYVKGNKGVTLEWVISVLPANCGPVLKACAKAAGREELPKGEA